MSAISLERDLDPDKLVRFYVTFEEKFLRYKIQEQHQQLLKELPSLKDFIACDGPDNKLSIHGMADERQLKLWFKKRGLPLSLSSYYVPFEIRLHQTYPNNDLSLIHQRIPSAHSLLCVPDVRKDMTLVSGFCDKTEYDAWRASLFFTKIYDIPFLLRREELEEALAKEAEDLVWTSHYEDGILKTKVTGYYIAS